MNKLFFWLLVCIVGFYYWSYYLQDTHVEENRNLAMRQFENSDEVQQQLRQLQWKRNITVEVFGLGWLFTGVYLMCTRVSNYIRWRSILKSCGLALMMLLSLNSIGCYRPYEPNQLEEIGTNEEGFLIPYTGDTKKQTSTNNEEFLRVNMVSTKQIRIPQQWIPSNYETFGPKGDWKPAAKLIRVDKAPVTREWTADSASGTSNKNEAIWVMTSDQVEFSTGWTCTARINSRDDAVKFLHNYPNGSLQAVLDTEVRAKIQALFGLEVTDLPMDELRKNSTPHMLRVIAEVEKFFLQRGINITNLGITGGFVYKNPSIQEKLVEVFNSEQEKNISIAKTQAQAENNKQIMLEATGKAQALLTQKKAEADGIRAVADAKAYEIQKAKEDLQTYLALKRLELETRKAEKWDGRFPQTFMGQKDGLDLLLNVPATEPVTRKKD